MRAHVRVVAHCAVPLLCAALNAAEVTDPEPEDATDAANDAATIEAIEAVVPLADTTIPASDNDAPPTPTAAVDAIELAGRTLLRVGTDSSANRGVVLWLTGTGTSAEIAAEWWSRAPGLNDGLVAYCPAPTANAWLARRDEAFLRSLLRALRRLHPNQPLVVAGSGGGARIIADIALTSHGRFAALVLFDGLPVPPYRTAKPNSPPISFYRGRLDRGLSHNTAHERIEALTAAGYHVSHAIEERDRTLDHLAWDAVISQFAPVPESNAPAAPTAGSGRE